MAFTYPFGDFSDNYQRNGLIPTGGLVIECGCITYGIDATFYVTTNMSRCVALAIDVGDGSDTLDEIPDVSVCVSSSYIKCGLTGSLSDGYCNYIAIGF